MDPLRIYLLAGMLLHKLVWELLKRRDRRPRARFSLVKSAKVCLLLGLLAQTLLPDVLPITAAPAALRGAGSLIYTIGLLVAIAGRLQLGRNWADIESAAVLPSQRVVDTGLYRYIRHPIYTGDLLLLLGLELALNSWLVAGLLPLLAAVRAKAIGEEKLLSGKLDGYPAYLQRTGRFLPRLARQ